MSTLTQFFSSTSSAGQFLQMRATNTSGQFTVPMDGKYLVTAIGGGGSGGSGTNLCRGGGAGGLAQSICALKAGDVISFTVGAGGAYVAGAPVPGNAGGTTTVTIPGYTTLTSNGGAGGAASGASAGGTAQGGNTMNVQGGSAGNANSSGGGAVGVYGTTPAPSTARYGAGVGESALSISIGYAGGSAISGLINTNTFLGRLLCPMGSGGKSGASDSFSAAGGPGAGGGYQAGNGGHGGLFAGGGYDAQNTQSGGYGGNFGGGGGPSGDNAASGKGGDGGVIIEFVF